MTGNNVEIDVTGRDRAEGLFDRMRAKADRTGRSIGDSLVGAGRRGAAGLSALSAAAAANARAMAGLDGRYARFNDRTRGLQVTISRVTEEVEDLEAQLRKTGDVELLKDIGRKRGELKKLTSLLGDAGEDGAEGFSARFSQRIGPLLTSAPISPPVVAGVAAAAPLISSLIGAAVSAGAAIGAVGIGAAIVAKTPEVQAAGQRLGAVLSGGLQAAATPMVRPVLSAMDKIEGAFDRLRPILRRTFADASRYVDPLTNAVIGMAEELAPAFRDVVNNAEPVIMVLAEEGPRAAETLGNALRMLSDDSEGSAQALSTMFTVLNGSITGAAGAIKVLGETFKWTSGMTLFFNDMLKDSKDETDKGKESSAGFAEAARAGAASTYDWAGKVRSLSEIMADFAEKSTTAFNAETKFGEVMDEITRKTINANAGISANTEKGRENREALSQLAAQTIESTNAMAGMAGGQAKANSIMSTGYNRFMALADAMGIDKRAARALAAQLGLIPKRTEPKVKTQGVNPSISEARRVQKKLEELERTYFSRIVVSTQWDTPANQRREERRGLASGGIVGAAAGGGPRGGSVLVGEAGPEIVELPYGSRVAPNGETRRRMAGGSGAGSGAPGYVEFGWAPGSEGRVLRAIQDALTVTAHRAGGGSLQTAIGGIGS